MTDPKDPTRRDFLRDAAAGGAALAVALILPKELEAAATPNYDWTRHRWVYLIDVTKCIGCGSCVRACKAENNVPKEFFRTWVERYEITVAKKLEDMNHYEGTTFVDSPEGAVKGFDTATPTQSIAKAFFVPKMCNHCTATPCIQVCPVGASYATADGVVLVDDKQCIGCGYCVQACPYGSRYIHPEKHVADKCTWCYHRITKGLLPACVQACPMVARRFGDRMNPDDPINQILATEKLAILQPELLTKPNCLYRGLSMEVR